MHIRPLAAMLAFVFAVPLTVAAAPSAPAAAPAAPEKLPAPDHWIPQQAVLALRVTDPKPLLDLVLHPGLLKMVQETPLYQAASKNKGWRDFQKLVRATEKRFDTDWQTLLGRLTAGGVTWAVGANGTSLLMLDAADEKTAHDMQEYLVMLARMGAQSGKSPPVQTVHHEGVDIWTLGPNQVHAVVGKRLLLANRIQGLRAVLNLRAKTGAKSLADLPAYRKACKAAGRKAAAILFANTGAIAKLRDGAKALGASGNPLLALLAAPITEAVGKSSFLAVRVGVKGQTLTLHAVTDGGISDTGAARFALPPKKGPGALPNLNVPGRVAAMTFYRDLRGFYAAKDKLFPERTSGLIFFENMMGIFFTGRDLTEEVLGELGPTARLVVAEQKYDPAIGTPAVKIPAFALVLKMKHPDRFAIVVEEAWQKAVGLINFTRGQQAQPGLIIDRPVFHGTKYTVATFAPAPSDDKVDKNALHIRYNFRPALAMPGEWLILSSTDGLAEDIMAALAKEKKGKRGSLGAVHSLIDIDGTKLAAVLEANRKNLIRQNMVDKGNTPEQAAIEVGMLVDIVKLISGLKLSLSAGKNESRAVLELRLALPAASAPTPPASPAENGER